MDFLNVYAEQVVCHREEVNKIALTRVSIASSSIETQAFTQQPREQQVVVDIAYQCNKPHGRGILWAFAPPFEGWSIPCNIPSLHILVSLSLSHTQPNQHALAAQFKSVFTLSLCLYFFYLTKFHRKHARSNFERDIERIKWPSGPLWVLLYHKNLKYSRRKIIFCKFSVV